MKAILVVCVPVCHVDVSSEKAAAQPNLDCFQSSARLGTGITEARRESSEREQATPPFWTWFIENPRAGGAA
jgi:hypothetical protein